MWEVLLLELSCVHPSPLGQAQHVGLAGGTAHVKFICLRDQVTSLL